MKEEVIKPITIDRSESEREKQVFLNMNKRKHWSEIWNKSSNGIWSRTHDPNNVTVEPKNMPAAGN